VSGAHDLDPRDFAPRLSVEQTGEDRFRAHLDGEGGPAFGGDLLGRAVMAATHTCEGKRLSSLHAHFLRAVPTSGPVDLVVERTSDGRRLAHRRVEIRRGDKRLFEAVARFAAGDEGIAYQEPTSPEDFPEPEELPSERECALAVGWDEWEPWVIEWRWQGDPSAAHDASTWLGWVRLCKPASLNAAQQAAAIAHVTDVHSDWAASRRAGGRYPRDRYISLDHAVWFHGTPRFDDWLLVRSRSDVAHGSRALTHREVFNRDGRLVASVCQEALLT
jgi:acyl-CoA thioesterase-2